MRKSQRYRFPHNCRPGWWYEDDSGIFVCCPDGAPMGMKIRYKDLVSAAERAAQRKSERAATANFKRKVPCKLNYRAF